MEQRNDMKHRLYLVGHPLGQWNPQFYFLYIHNLALWKVSSISIVSSTAYIPVTGEGNGTPLQYSCLENPMDGGAWWAAVHAVPKSWAQLSDFTFTFPFHALEKEMATHSSVLAWRIPGTGEPGGLPSMGSHRVGHDWSDLAAAAYSSDTKFCSNIFLSSWSTDPVPMEQYNLGICPKYNLLLFLSNLLLKKSVTLSVNGITSTHLFEPETQVQSQISPFQWRSWSQLPPTCNRYSCKPLSNSSLCDVMLVAWKWPWWLSSETQEITSVGKHVEKRRPLCTTCTQWNIIQPW